MKPKLYLILFTIIALSSCKTASKLYEKGDYDEAVALAAKKLQRDPGDPKLIAIIRDAYRYALDDHQHKIALDEASTSDLRYESIYHEYVSLQKLYDAIHKVPSVFSILDPIDYTADVIEFRDRAADVRMDRGLSLMEGQSKEDYRDAYHEFQEALDLRPNDPKATEQMDIAYEKAVTNIVVLPLQQDGGFVYSSYNVGENNLDDQLISSLRQSSGNPFVRFYSSWDARSLRVRVDQQLSLQLQAMEPARSFDQRSTRKVSKEVVIKETVYKPDSVVKQYGKVTADITTTTRSINASAVLRITATDADGQWLWSANVPANYYWSTSFSTYSGDERALSDADRDLINRRREFAPTQSDIMRDLVSQLENDASFRVRDYSTRL